MQVKINARIFRANIMKPYFGASSLSAIFLSVNKAQVRCFITNLLIKSIFFSFVALHICYFKVSVKFALFSFVSPSIH